MKALVYVLAGIGASALVAHVYFRGWKQVKDDAFQAIGRSPKALRERGAL